MTGELCAVGGCGCLAAREVRIVDGATGGYRYREARQLLCQAHLEAMRAIIAAYHAQGVGLELVLEELGPGVRRCVTLRSGAVAAGGREGPCDARAVAEQRWPGRDPIPVCARCLQWAQEVSTVLGFVLAVEEIDNPDPAADPTAARFALLELT